VAVANRAVCNSDAQREEQPLQIGSPGSQTRLQALIDTLVDIDVAFERECQELSPGTLDAASQDRMLTKLREQHRQSRTPYVQQLIAQREDSRVRDGSPGQSPSGG